MADSEYIKLKAYAIVVDKKQVLSIDGKSPFYNLHGSVIPVVSKNPMLKMRFNGSIITDANGVPEYHVNAVKSVLKGLFNAYN